MPNQKRIGSESTLANHLRLKSIRSFLTVNGYRIFCIAPGFFPTQPKQDSRVKLFIDSPSTIWKHFHAGLSPHEKNTYHQTSVIKLISFKWTHQNPGWRIGNNIKEMPLSV